MSYSALQKTLAQEVHFEGIGVHHGKSTQCTVTPNNEDSGIVFKRADLRNNSNSVPAHYTNVSSTSLCTTIAASTGGTSSISTIEHMMFALWACEIDNAIITIDGDEVPILDGSAQTFINAFRSAGSTTLKKKRQYLKVNKKIEVRNKDQHIILSPSNHFSVDYTIDYDHPAIRKQRYYFVKEHLETYDSESRETQHLVNQININSICNARTFGFINDVEQLKKQGLALGASQDNSVGLTKDGIMDNTQLRYNNEFVRHKVLDCIGDLYLASMPMLCNVQAVKSGHSMNHKVLCELFNDPSAYSITK